MVLPYVQLKLEILNLFDVYHTWMLQGATLVSSVKGQTQVPTNKQNLK